ncbi:hypothetical protein IG631_12471 [Alternaria alternata]|nr:hypothetical protein IG631_12471 [Alternaria alternata]
MATECLEKHVELGKPLGMLSQASAGETSGRSVVSTPSGIDQVHVNLVDTRSFRFRCGRVHATRFHVATRLLHDDCIPMTMPSGPPPSPSRRPSTPPRALPYPDTRLRDAA